jgi:hypothetical protein
MQRVGVLFTVMLSGCSFVLVSGPPSNHAQLPSFDCTTSRVGPILDTVWTGLQVLRIIGTASTSDAEWQQRIDDSTPGAPSWSRSTDLAIGAALGALGAAGMYYGFSRTGECRSAKSALNARVMQPGGMGGQPAPGTWPPPGQGPAPQGTWPPPGQPQGDPSQYPAQPQPNQAQPQPYPAPPPPATP